MKKIISAALCATMLLGTAALTSCDSYKKTPSDFKLPYSDYNLADYVTLGEYKGLEYTEIDTIVTSDQIDAKIKELLSDYTTEELITDRGAQYGDTLSIKYTGFVDGEQLENGSGSDTITLGSSGYIDGFDAGLVGVKAEETTTLHLTFPDPYPNNTDLSGKAVEFIVRVNSIRGASDIDLTDEFIAGLEKEEYTTVDGLRAYAEKLALEDNKESARDKAVSELWNKVMNSCTFTSVPEKEVRDYADNMMSQYKAYADNYNLTMEEFCEQMMGMDYDTFSSQVKAYAEANIKQEIVLMSIVNAEKLRLTDKEYDAGMEKIAEQQSTTVEQLESNYDFEILWKSIMWDKVLDFIVDNGKPVAAAETTASADTTEADTAA